MMRRPLAALQTHNTTERSIMHSFTYQSWIFALVILEFLTLTAAFSSSSPTGSATTPSSSSSTQPVGNILILDHLNINHEKGRHDWLKAFYFDFLKCVVDPRKAENLELGTKTLWANIGAHQFHLPEGKPDAQVLQGVVTLVFPDLKVLESRFKELQPRLEGSKFGMTTMTTNGDASFLLVTDPWGTQFRIVQGGEEDRDERGEQPGGSSEGIALRDLTFYTPVGTRMEGIARFYEKILGAPIIECNNNQCIVSVGPKQTLTFTQHPEAKSLVAHEDLRDDAVEPPEGFPSYLSNYGPHVSIYVADLPGAYRRAQEAGVAYVNPRFKRRAYTLDQAIDDCMFRCLDIVDPDSNDGTVLLKLEHEVRSVVRRDGSKYKSCPFSVIPECCKESK